MSVGFEGDQVANHANRLKLAKSFLVDPNAQYPRVLRYVVAANAALSLASITGMADGDIQSHVDASLAILADGD